MICGGIQGILYYGCSVDYSYGVMKTDRCVLCVLKFSACELCSSSHNFFVVY
jgi:hypothetical protein